MHILIEFEPMVERVDIPKFCRILAVMMIIMTGYYLYYDFDYLVLGFTNQAYFSFGFIMLPLWYVFTFRTIYSLLKFDRLTWYLTNAWLIYSMASRITSYITFKYVYHIEVTGGEIPNFLFLFILLLLL